MDVEVVAAGVAANELRDDGDEGGEEDDSGPTTEILGPQDERTVLRPFLIPVP